MEVTAIVACSLSFVLGIVILYFTHQMLRYSIWMGIYYLYILAISVFSLPILLYNGRCTKNLHVLSRMMDPGRCLFGIKSEVRKYDNMIQDKPCVIVSNHQSSLDLFGMAELYPQRASFMAKRSLLYLGPIGLALWLAGGIFVNRANNDKSAQAFIEHISKEVLDRQLQLWIFPEGTRGHIRGMLAFKKGAFNIAVMGKIPIVPVVFKSYEDFYDRKNYKFESGKYVVEVLPPIATDEKVLDDVPELADEVWEKMLEVYNRLSGFDVDCTKGEGKN